MLPEKWMVFISGPPWLVLETAQRKVERLSARPSLAKPTLCPIMSRCINISTYNPLYPPYLIKFLTRLGPSTLKLVDKSLPKYGPWKEDPDLAKTG